ncbi:MAG TPA: hypothetical protein VFF20_06665 [Pseudogracilibacillus sp.]|nr:hypothetical protein [Pseudogracilibacillus sp.]
MFPRISLMELYLIETLRANGVTDDLIIERVKARDVTEFAPYHEQFDFADLYALDEAGILVEVLEKGYKVKFLTYTGLVNILELKFNKKKGEDYLADQFTISGLHLSAEEIATLGHILSDNWSLTVQEDGVTIEPLAKPSLS